MQWGSATSPGRSVVRTVFAAAVILAALTSPMLLYRHANAARYAENFQRKRQHRVVKARPEVVLIGNSMLHSRIAPGILRDVSGGLDAYILSKGGSASASWYLFLKNFALAPEPPPKTALIMFRDRVLTIPDYRTTGIYWRFIQSLMPAPDRDVLRLTGHGKPLPERLYPVLSLRPAIAERLRRSLKNLLAGSHAADSLDSSLDTTFRLGNLRRDLPPEKPSAEEARERSVAFENSFLPLMFDAADRAGTKLVFYRVQVRPGDPVTTDAAELARYLADLRKYIEARGGILLDETGDERITREFFADNDHLAEDHQQAYAEIFWEHVRDYLR